MSTRSQQFEYPCLTAIIQFFPIRERHELLRGIPELRKFERAIPYTFGTEVELLGSKILSTLNLHVDSFYRFKVKIEKKTITVRKLKPDEYPESDDEEENPFRDPEALGPNEFKVTDANECFERIVSYYLNRPGTVFRSLECWDYFPYLAHTVKRIDELTIQTCYEKPLPDFFEILRLNIEKIDVSFSNFAKDIGCYLTQGKMDYLSFSTGRLIEDAVFELPVKGFEYFEHITGGNFSACDRFFKMIDKMRNTPDLQIGSTYHISHYTDLPVARWDEQFNQKMVEIGARQTIIDCYREGTKRFEYRLQLSKSTELDISGCEGTSTKDSQLALIVRLVTKTKKKRNRPHRRRKNKKRR